MERALVRAIPTSELGHAQPSTFWDVDADETPDLRWPLSVKVYDRMRREDSQCASVLRAVSLPVLRTGWRVASNGARPEVAKFIADELGLPLDGEPPTSFPRSRDRFSWLEHLRLAMRMLPFGHSFFEQICRPPDGDGRVHLRKLAFRPSKTISSVNVSPDGGLLSIEQFPIGGTNIGLAGITARGIEIPVSRLVAYVYDREGGNWFGTSLLRPAYKHWILKDRLIRNQAETNLRNGMGVPVIEADEKATEEDITKYARMAQAYRSGNQAGTALPFGAKLRLLGVEGALPDADGPIRYHDEQIAKAVLAHFLNLNGQGGSYALASVQADTFAQSLQTIAQQIADTATQHIVEDLVDWNWGPDEPAPRVAFEEIGSRQGATAQAIKLLVDAGIIFPDRQLEESTRQTFGLPPKDPRAPTSNPAPPASPLAEPDSTETP